MNGSDFWKAFATPFWLLLLFVIAFFAISGITKSRIKAPTIDLITSNEIVTDQAEVPITGVVHNTSKLKINGKDVSVNKDGGFSSVVPVNTGENNIELTAGNSDQAKTSVRVVREEKQQMVASTSVTTSVTTSDLTSSGPVETIFGSFGLTAILLSCAIYYRSTRQNYFRRA